jgi:hypothetical protein
MTLKKSLPVMRYGALKFKNCISIFSETVRDSVKKFSGMSDRSIGVCKWVCGCRPSLPIQTGSDKKIENFKVNVLN